MSIIMDGLRNLCANPTARYHEFYTSRVISRDDQDGTFSYWPPLIVERAPN